MDGFSVGDKFVYKIRILVPEIIAGEEMALNAEMYSLDSSSQPGFLHICDPLIEGVGNFITKSNENFNLTKDDQIAYKVVKGSISMEVHTSGQGGANPAEQNWIILKFTALIIPGVNLVPNGVYSVVSTVTYGPDEKYIWAGSHDLTAGKLTRKSPRRASAKLESRITSLKRGESKVLEVHVYSQHAGTSFRVEVSGSGRYDNVHIGTPVVEWGEAFSCQDLHLAKIQYSKALTNKNYQKTEYTFPVMMNKDVSNPMELTSNRIKVMVPITAMKGTKGVEENNISVGISIDETDVWGIISDIIINTLEFIPTLSQPLVNGSLLTSEPDAIYPGSSAIFQIDCHVPVVSAVELLVEASGRPGVNPVDIRLVDEGLCGRILKEERRMDGSTLKVDFGICSNFHSSQAIKTVMYVAYSISPTAGTGSYELVVKVGVPVSLSLEVKSAPTSAGTVIGKGKLIGFESPEIRDAQEIGINLKLKFPSDFLGGSLKLEDVPYSNDGSKNPEIHICAIRFQEIGYGLPCIHATSLTSVLESSKSGNNAVWDLNSTCPANLGIHDKSVSRDSF